MKKLILVLVALVGLVVFGFSQNALNEVSKPVASATPSVSASPAPSATPATSVVSDESDALESNVKSERVVTTDDGWKMFVGSAEEAREYYESIGFAETVKLAANTGKYYKALPEDAITLTYVDEDGEEKDWSIYQLKWEGYTDIYRYGNSIPIMSKDGKTCDKKFSGDEDDFPQMSDKKAQKSAICVHGKLKKSWVTNNVYADAEAFLGNLSSENGCEDPKIFKSYKSCRNSSTVDNEPVEGWIIAVDFCEESHATTTKKSSSKKSSSGGKKPSKPSDNDGNQENNPRPSADLTKKPAQSTSNNSGSSSGSGNVSTGGGNSSRPSMDSGSSNTGSGKVSSDNPPMT